MQEEKQEELPWKSRAEIREYFSKKEGKLKGLEEIPDEDD